MAEFAVVLLFAMTGAMLIAASTDLLLLFLALELMVLPGYMLAAYHKTDGYSTEGAIKYFLLGSFSSAIFLFGLAFVWGLTGSTRIADAAALGTATTPGAFSPGLAMGFAFLTTASRSRSRPSRSTTGHGRLPARRRRSPAISRSGRRSARSR